MDMTKCAVTVEWLVKFATSNDLLEKKTREVVSDIVIPQTQANRSRYVELLALQNKSICGPVDVFVSHSWATKFGTLVSAVAENSRPGRRVWIDIFAVKQHRGDDQQSDLTQLKTVLRESPEGTLLVMDPEAAGRDRHADPTKRIWCIYEFFHTLQLRKPLLIKFGTMSTKRMLETAEGFVPEFVASTQKHLFDKFTTEVDVLKAEASHQPDKQMILEQLKLAGRLRVEKTVADALWAHYTSSRGAKKEHNGCISRLMEYAIQGTNPRGSHFWQEVSVTKFVAAALEMVNPEGYTSLHCAATAGYVDVIRLLLRAKASPDKPNLKGRTPLLIAAWNGHSDVIAELLKHKASVSQRDRHYQSPLAMAARAGYVDTVRFLLQSGAVVATAREAQSLMRAVNSHIQNLNRAVPSRVTVPERLTPRPSEEVSPKSPTACSDKATPTAKPEAIRPKPTTESTKPAPGEQPVTESSQPTNKTSEPSESAATPSPPTCEAKADSAPPLPPPLSVAVSVSKKTKSNRHTSSPRYTNMDDEHRKELQGRLKQCLDMIQDVCKGYFSNDAKGGSSRWRGERGRHAGRRGERCRYDDNSYHHVECNHDTRRQYRHRDRETDRYNRYHIERKRHERSYNHERDRSRDGDHHDRKRLKYCADRRPRAREARLCQNRSQKSSMVSISVQEPKDSVAEELSDRGTTAPAPIDQKSTHDIEQESK